MIKIALTLAYSSQEVSATPSWPDSSLCTLLTGCKYKMSIICLDALTLLIGGKCAERIWIYLGPSSFFFQKVSAT